MHGRRPYLHDSVVTLAAPWVVVSPPSGQLSGAGVEGVFAADRRVLSVLRVTVDGREPEPVHVDEYDAGSATYDAVVESLGDTGHDPTVTLHRRRVLEGRGLSETISLVNRSRGTVECDLAVALGTDLAGTAAVRSGAAAELRDRPAEAEAGTLRWRDEDVVVTVELDPVPDKLDTEARWHCRIEPGGSVGITVRVGASFEPGEGFRVDPPPARPAYGLEVDCDDHRFARWVRRSLADVAGLMLGDGDDRYLGAGPPWYLTLFGRDSLISAGMLLAVDPELAAGTTRALARRQGTRVDPGAAEQPGKIPHELRAAVADHGAGMVLPAAYYGTHDATQLWITTLHNAWRWGMPADQVGEAIPALEKALGWLRDSADPDGDGFLEYIDESGHGLANQGWKDSPDGIQWPDGTLAEAPIALSEVQAYAYAAALAGADLLTAYDRAEEAAAWREWAAALKARFRPAFWVDDEQGGYPAIALDAAKRPVAGPASNMGHLLGTGILDADDEAIVALRLGGEDLDSGFGLRTLSTTAVRFNPLGYHTGSVWPHDTAIAVQGLYAAGQSIVAGSFVAGLTTAAESFAYRLPELYGGLGRAEETTPTPYPLSCRPQAWAAASAVAVLVAVLGIEPDVPNGVLRIRPADPFPWRRLEVRGLRVGTGVLSLRVEDGRLTILEAPDGLVVTGKGQAG